MAATAINDESVIEIVRKYIHELERHGIHIEEAVIFGSFAKGFGREESDIDVALVSSFFTGDRFEDRRKIVPYRRTIDSRIEPIPFRPEDYSGGGNLVEDIKKTGIKIK